VRIGIDIDGVLYPWAQAANEAVMEKFGVPDPGPHRQWDWLKKQLTPDQWAWVWTQEASDAVFGRVGLTYPGVVEAFVAILASGHECHFVTHRSPARTGLATAEFLARHFGHARWEGTHVVTAGTPKRTIAEWDVFIDDKPETVCDFLANTEAQVFAPMRPWNMELDPEADRFVHYLDPREVAEWVLSR
jgi:hypothetical protein